LRAVLDPNVIVSAALSPAGAPARIVRRWLEGEFELVVSPKLVAELRRVLAYPKISRLVPDEDARALTLLIEGEGESIADPDAGSPVAVEDPDDEYLIALAAACGAPLVSGDKHLTALAGRFPVFTPADFLAALDGSGISSSRGR
jgi:putative PIN family toxin of toxin-antitoxin system